MKLLQILILLLLLASCSEIEDSQIVNTEYENNLYNTLKNYSLFDDLKSSLPPNDEITKLYKKGYTENQIISKYLESFETKSNLVLNVVRDYETQLPKEEILQFLILNTGQEFSSFENKFYNKLIDNAGHEDKYPILEEYNTLIKYMANTQLSKNEYIRLKNLKEGFELGFHLYPDILTKDTAESIGGSAIVGGLFGLVTGGISGFMGGTAATIVVGGIGGGPGALVGGISGMIGGMIGGAVQGAVQCIIF